MATPKSIAACHLLDFREVVGDRHVVTTTVGPELNLVILSLGKTPDYRVEQAGTSFAQKEANQSNDFRIHYLVEDEWYTVDVDATNENIHAVQPIGADQWLLVRGRAMSPADRNAHIINSEGRTVRSFHAGDGIEDVQVTVDSRIWCSFFDEGVYSGMAMGQSGLICLDSHGNKCFDYGQISGQVSPIDDCYALNVSGKHETWLCYYSDFPLVRITDFQLKQYWPRIPVSGSHAFAVAGSHALFFGSYNKKQMLFEVNLPTRRLRTMFAVREEGSRIKVSGAFGRAHRLYLVTEESLFLVDWNV